MNLPIKSARLLALSALSLAILAACGPSGSDSATTAGTSANSRGDAAGNTTTRPADNTSEDRKSVV